MGDVAIHADSLSKLYRIGPRERYKALRDTLSDAVYAPFRRIRSIFQRPSILGSQFLNGDNTIWALKGVSFQVRQGEVVGIIGRNGAGKSTLLKILSRITEPTEGQAEIIGRVGSLLEVGTGFHPELTGRENIFLNGAILGMRRAEIERRFDEIVAFAEVEKFIDTPAKRYSSGMYVRLAFAVAAHLEPEILLVDEVLAVGDMEFQKKCLGRMERVGREGRTILFVSHNMPSITRLCSRAILLDQGRIVKDGPADEIVRLYFHDGVESQGERSWADLSKAPGDEVVRLRAVRVCSQGGTITSRVETHNSFAVELEFYNLCSRKQLIAALYVFNESGVCLFSSNNFHDPVLREGIPAGSPFKCVCWIPEDLLTEGCITLGVYMVSLGPTVVHVKESEVISLEVVETGEGVRGNYAYGWPGVVRPRLRWLTERTPPDAGPAA